MKYEIKKGIPIPPPRRRQKSEIRLILESMSVGDMIEFPFSERKSVDSACSIIRMVNKWKFSIRAIDPSQKHSAFRIWRAA